MFCLTMYQNRCIKSYWPLLIVSISNCLLPTQVDELKTEMDVVSGEVQAQEEGYEKLKKVDRKLSSHHGCKKEDVQSLVEEIQSIQRTNNAKEQEKNDLIQALLRLRDKLSQPDVSHEVRIKDPLLDLPKGSGVYVNEEVLTANQF